MSKYTTQIRFLVEMNSTEGAPIGKRIIEALPKIFNFDFPIWDENYRTTLEKKIIMHYFTKETCNVVGLWKLWLEERLNLIMPYYNQLYTTVANKYNWLEDINLTETYQNNKNINSKTTDTGTGKMTGNDTQTGTDNIDKTVNGKNLKSDLPQATYAGDYGTELIENEGKDTIKQNNSLENNRTVDTTNTNNTENTNTQNENFTRKHQGLNGSRTLTQLNLEYRNSLLNIDKMIIDELQDLFMLIY